MCVYVCRRRTSKCKNELTENCVEFVLNTKWCLNPYGASQFVQGLCNLKLFAQNYYVIQPLNDRFPSHPIPIPDQPIISGFQKNIPISQFIIIKLIPPLPLFVLEFDFRTLTLSLPLLLLRHLKHLLLRHCGHVGHQHLIDERAKAQAEVGGDLPHFNGQRVAQHRQTHLVVLH